LACKQRWFRDVYSKHPPPLLPPLNLREENRPLSEQKFSEKIQIFKDDNFFSIAT
jgi:hypothetical protein